MTEPFFKNIDRIPFKGPDADDPLAFTHYDPDRMVLGKRMADPLRVAVCWWHTFCWPGTDMFGAGTFGRPWQTEDTLETAEAKLYAAFEFFEKLGAPFFCFHDADVAPLGETIVEGNANLAHIEEFGAAGGDPDLTETR